MKRIYNYILLAVVALVAVSCNNEELTPDKPTAERGDEVQFGLSLGNPETKTVYGDETGDVFPIYWVNEDKVQIFSPQCLDGRRNAEYKVAVSGTQQNYADKLTKTGDIGVQWSSWGDNEGELYSFYSLYPSGNYTLSDDGTKAENIVINYSQNIVVNGDVIKSDMEDCLMYASKDKVKRGETVNLTYNPISTVVYVTLKVAAGTGTTTNEYTIQSISLVADQDIAGTFSLKVADGSFVEFVAGKASSTVSAQIASSATGGFHTISNGESLSVPLFIAPITKLNVKNWKIQVVANNTTYTKTLNIDKVLEPGEIHKITLPELSATSTEWSTGNWMENIPRNVYLSEVSIPGSWNTLNEDYQSNTSINDQYDIGIRGFHFDTRWRTDDKESNWLGYLEGDINGLSVAGGAESDNYGGISGDRVVNGNAKTFAEYLKQITDNIVDKNGVPKEEYMILTCTFAQDSYDYSYTTDGVTYNWASEISKACDANEYVLDAKTITKDKLIGDVLGKVIVIVNLEGTVSSVPADSKCLFINMPLTLSSTLFPTALSERNYGPLYKATNNTTTPVDSEIDMYHTQAQICINEENTTYSGSGDRSDVQGRGYAPTMGERKMVANNILNWSKENYGTENYVHDKWIYLGLGGYYVNYTYSWREVADSNDDVGTNLNTWINGKVTEMGTTPSGQTSVVPYYPVGIVLMNYVNNHPTVVSNILTLNNKYRLQYNPDYPTDYNPNATPQSAAASYSSGMNDSNVAAFGWD